MLPCCCYCCCCYHRCYCRRHRFLLLPLLLVIVLLFILILIWIKGVMLDWHPIYLCLTVCTQQDIWNQEGNWSWFKDKGLGINLKSNRWNRHLRMTEDMINHKEGLNTELQEKCSRGRPYSKWEPLVRKDVLQNNGRTT